MQKYRYSFNEAKKINKFGVDISLYGMGKDDINIVYEEVKEGHFEEFLNTVSAITWFIIEGNGTFVIDDEKISVSSKDIISIPPNHRIHYFGTMKMILISTPAFKQENERHIRNVNKEESPYFKN